MVVVNKFDSTDYCAKAKAVPAGCKQAEHPDERCTKAHRVTYTCTLGPISPEAAQAGGQFGFGFEIIAALVDGSDPAECTHGQFNQFSHTEDGAKVPNGPAERRPPPGDHSFANQAGPPTVITAVAGLVPQFDAAADGKLKMGADSFTKPDINLIHDAEAGLGEDGQRHPGISWVDTPLSGIDRKEDQVWHSRFLAFINGTAGKPGCYCQFTLKRALAKKPAAPPGTSEFALEKGLHCHAAPDRKAK
jgi:hypothetical protein